MPKFSPGAISRFVEAAIWTGFDSDSLLMSSHSLHVVDSTVPSSGARKLWWINSIISRGGTHRRSSAAGHVENGDRTELGLDAMDVDRGGLRGYGCAERVHI